MFSSATFFALSALYANVGLVSAIPTKVFTNSTAGPLAAPFSVNIGNTNTDIVTWVSGQSKCNHVILGPNSTNPCSRAFGLNGQSGFIVEGCSGPLQINQNSNFWANCVDYIEGSMCSVTTGFHCV